MVERSATRRSKQNRLHLQAVLCDLDGNEPPRC